MLRHCGPPPLIELAGIIALGRVADWRQRTRQKLNACGRLPNYDLARSRTLKTTQRIHQHFVASIPAGNLAPQVLAPSSNTLPISAPVKSAFLRSALLRFTPVKSAPFKFAPVSTTLARLEYERLLPERLILAMRARRISAASKRGPH